MRRTVHNHPVRCRRVRFRFFLLSVAAAFCLVLLLSPLHAQLPTGGRRLLTLDDIFGPSRPLDAWGSIPYVTGWRTSGREYLEYADNGAGEIQLMRVDAQTGQTTPLYDAARMEAALGALPGIDMAAAHRLSYRESYTMDPAETSILLSHADALYLYTFKTGRAVRLTATYAKSAATDASFSPDGKSVAFVREGNLFVVSVAAPGQERRLTSDGGPKILNGRLDWVYEEEVYGRGSTSGYAWNPDSRSIAFLRLDENPVRPFVLVNALPTEQATEQQYYPLPGDPNPVASLGIVGVEGKAPPRFADLAAYGDQDRLLVRFAWAPDGTRLTLQVQDRVQSFLDLLFVNPLTGKTSRILRETTPRWVEPTGNPKWLTDGTFLWLSDRSGFRHLYRYSADGKVIAQITRGEWDIRTLFGVDAANAYVYFSAAEHTPLATHVYRVWLADPASAAAPQRLTEAEGTHTARFDPTFTRFLDQSSGIDTPPRLRIAEAATGKDIRRLGDSAETVRQLAPFRFSRPEFVTVKARDGFPLEAVIIRPPDFDPLKKYPVVYPLYGGPGAQTVKDEWSGRDFLTWQLLAQKGFIVWMCDNRSASGKGARSQWPLYKALGVSELADMEDGLAYLKKQPGTDPSRIALFGWSYGGFLAEYALTHSKTFKIGIAAAGVSDWRLYDTIYTERYLDTPARNPDGYRLSSPLYAAEEYTGRLLLLHGMMDDNVHLQNTMRLADALQKSGKRFDMQLYAGPDARHGFADGQLDRHVNITLLEYLLQNL